MNAAPIVKDLMTKQVITLHPDQEIREAIHLLFRKRISGAPVVDDKRRLLGMLSEKDCLRTLMNGAYTAAPGGFVREFMSVDITTCGEEDDLFKIADLFFKNSFRRLPVLRNGELVGLVSRIHVLRGSMALCEGDGRTDHLDNGGVLTEQLKASLRGTPRAKRSDVRRDSTEHVGI